MVEEELILVLALVVQVVAEQPQGQRPVLLLQVLRIQEVEEVVVKVVLLVEQAEKALLY